MELIKIHFKQKKAHWNDQASFPPDTSFFHPGLICSAYSDWEINLKP